MGFRPCFGPCDVSWIEWVEYGVLLVGALGLIWLTYRILRRLAGSNQRAARFVPIVTGGVAVFLTVNLTMFAMEEVAKHSWPTVTVGRQGMVESDPIFLGGDYWVYWSAKTGQSGCHLDATLRRFDDAPYAQLLASEALPAQTSSGSSTSSMTFDRGAYYLDADSDCPAWSITFQPRPSGRR